MAWTYAFFTSRHRTVAGLARFVLSRKLVSTGQLKEGEKMLAAAIRNIGEAAENAGVYEQKMPYRHSDIVRNLKAETLELIKEDWIKGRAYLKENNPREFLALDLAKTVSQAVEKTDDEVGKEVFKGWLTKAGKGGKQ